MSRRVTKAKAEKIAKAWAQALRLGDWVIDIEVKKIEGDDSAQVSYIDELRKRCTISVDPYKDASGKESKLGDPDPEIDIVHELVHLHLYSMYAIFEKVLADHCKNKESRKTLNDLFEAVEESAIHQISATLVSLRKKRGKLSSER